MDFIPLEILKSKPDKKCQRWGGEVAINLARFCSHDMQNIRQDHRTVYFWLYSYYDCKSEFPHASEFPLHTAFCGLKVPIQSHGTKHRYESESKFKLFQNLRLET